jgi:hypothetical protein
VVRGKRQSRRSLPGPGPAARALGVALLVADCRC